MRISLNWLKNYIDLKNSPEQIAQTLTGIGLEVESIEYLGQQFEGFVIGEVKDVQKHPNADRLSVCKVLLSQNSQPQQIVCGAPNVAVGQKVIVGLPDAVIPKNQHDPNGKPFVLTKAKIRGVESNGMICSEFELGLGEDKNGIKVLDAKAKIGTPLSEFLGRNDVAFEIGVTPNRPDCLSHLGVARDLAAALGKKLKRPEIKIRENTALRHPVQRDKKLSIKKFATVKVENIVDCPRYTARLIRNIKVKPSPDWLQNYLHSIGLRPINNIVDITNFILMEYGQPLHAFDYDTLHAHTIVVKNSKQGEKFNTLDGKSHTLSENDLMICDGEKPVGIAGVMGGLNSEISESTTNVLLEAAYFSPITIRKTAKRLKINSDAAYRFERGTDPNVILEASARAASLIAELGDGEIVSGVIDIYPKKISPKKISLRISKLNTLLGINISLAKVTSLLNSIEIKIEKKISSYKIVCVVPTFRPDIEQEIDLIEEVARLYGYDNIPNAISGDTIFCKPLKTEIKVQEIRSWLESNGFNEIMTNSMMEEKLASEFSSNLVKVRNPLGSELEILRPSLMPMMLDSVRFNYNHGATSIRFYEIGNVFKTIDGAQKSAFIDGLTEETKLSLCLSGFHSDRNWYSEHRKVDIYDIKGTVQSLVSTLGLDNINLICYDASSSLTEQTLNVEMNGTYVGFIGKCSSEMLRKFKIENDVYYGELDLDVLIKSNLSSKFKEFSKFPNVIRDIAFIINKSVSIKELTDTIKTAGGELVRSVTLFDVFQGKNLEEGTKSVAFSLSINSFEKTLTDSEIEKIVKTIVAEITTKYNAVFRSI